MPRGRHPTCSAGERRQGRSCPRYPWRLRRGRRRCRACSSGPLFAAQVSRRSASRRAPRRRPLCLRSHCCRDRSMSGTVRAAGRRFLLDSCFGLIVFSAYGRRMRGLCPNVLSRAGGGAARAEPTGAAGRSRLARECERDRTAGRDGSHVHGGERCGWREMVVRMAAKRHSEPEKPGAAGADGQLHVPLVDRQHACARKPDRRGCRVPAHPDAGAGLFCFVEVKRDVDGARIAWPLERRAQRELANGCSATSSARCRRSPGGSPTDAESFLVKLDSDENPTAAARPVRAGQQQALGFGHTHRRQVSARRKPQGRPKHPAEVIGAVPGFICEIHHVDLGEIWPARRGLHTLHRMGLELCDGAHGCCQLRSAIAASAPASAAGFVNIGQ